MPDGWRLAALSPLPAEAFTGWLGGLPLRVSVPASRDRAGLHRVLADAELVLGDWTGELALGAQEAAAAPRLAFVQQPSVGVEHIDLNAFASRGVPVANTAGANAEAVAEWCVGAALSVLRCTLWADREVRAGRWPQLELADRGCAELSGRRVGLVGYGPIGVACAHRFAAFGCPVAYWSRHRRAPAAERPAGYLQLAELLPASDVLVVAIALGAETSGLLDADRLDSLPAGAVVVNAARGGIVDEEAVARLVTAGRLAGAAFDVFGTEPLPADSPLRRTDRVLLSPHAAGATAGARARVVQTTVDNLRRAVTGQPVRWVRNGVDPLVRRR